jgi:hypothetical protein
MVARKAPLLAMKPSSLATELFLPGRDINA